MIHVIYIIVYSILTLYVIYLLVDSIGNRKREERLERINILKSEVSKGKKRK